MVGFALAAVLWHMSSVDRDPVLALASDVARGAVVESSDLEVAYVGSDHDIAHLSEAERASVVGRVALADLEAGTLLTRGMLADEAAVASGEGVVGLALKAGQLPTSTLLPGDRVNVVAGEASSSEPLVEAAEVFSVEALDGGDGRFVALQMPEGPANTVAAAAERGAIRLVLVGR